MSQARPLDWMPRLGDLVDYHAVIDGPVTLASTRLRSEPFQASNGAWVCFVERKSGYVAVDALTPAEVAS